MEKLRIIWKDGEIKNNMERQRETRDDMER